MQAHGTLEFSGGGGGIPGPGTIPLTSLAPQAANTVVANATGGAASPTAVPLDATLAFSGGSLTRAAISGDVTIAAGSNTSAIGANKVTNAMLAQAAANTLKGNATGALANETDITLGAGLTFTGGQLALASTGGPYVLKAGDTMTGPLTVNAGSNFTPGTSGITLRSDDPGATGPGLITYHNSASPAVSDALAGFNFWGKNSAAADFRYGGLLAFLASPTAGAEACSYGFYTAIAGTVAQRLGVGSGVSVGAASDPGVGSLAASGILRTGQYTVATLPAAGTVGGGSRAFVTDAAAVPVLSAVATGGGALGLAVYSDGTNWRNG